MLGLVGYSADRRTWAFAFNVKQLDLPAQPACRLELRRWPLGQNSRCVVGDSYGLIEGLVLHPSGECLAVVERERSTHELRLSIISTSSGAVERTGTSPAWRPHRGFAWSPDGTWLVIGTDEGHALVDAIGLGVKGQLAGVGEAASLRAGGAFRERDGTKSTGKGERSWLRLKWELLG